MAPTPSADSGIQRLAAALSPEWLAAQRWYRGKTRRIVRVELLDAARLEGSGGWLLVLGATDAAGDLARYLVPAIADGDAFREPRDGERVWAALAGLMLAGHTLEGAHGRWAFESTAAAAGLLPGGRSALAELAEQRLGVEQSNTSVAFGDRLMLKVYRLLEPGINPEVEVNAFLTDAGFAQAPLLAGSASYLVDGQAYSAAMLQQFIASTGDGWRWTLDRLAAQPNGPTEALAGMAQIGSLTAQMHRALASRPDTPGFPSRSATGDERATWRLAADGQLAKAEASLDGALRARLEAIAPRAAGRLDAIQQAESVGVSRIHGDYHLGQLLLTADGFVVIDFEGEPARALAERRAPASPLRDVAGMLRSLDYAVRAAEGRMGEDWTQGWLRDARAAFLEGYGAIRPQDEPLLAAFEIEKACYEVGYEANNRPDWIELPLSALERMTA